MERMSELREAYADLLDCEGDVTVAGYQFLPSRVLREVDPIAYRQGLLDYADSEDIDTDDLEDD